MDQILFSAASMADHSLNKREAEAEVRTQTFPVKQFVDKLGRKECSGTTA
jgi:hypothetical protein